MTRLRWFEALTLAAATAASFATSAPPPDWTQHDELPQRVLTLAPGEATQLAFYAEGPPEAFGVGVNLASDERPTFAVVFLPEGGDERCGAETVDLDDWSVRPVGQPARYHAALSVPKACLPGERGELRVEFRAPVSPGPGPGRPLTLYVDVVGSASGDDDEPPEPPVRLEPH